MQHNTPKSVLLIKLSDLNGTPPFVSVSAKSDTAANCDGSQALIDSTNQKKSEEWQTKIKTNISKP